MNKQDMIQIFEKAYQEGLMKVDSVSEDIINKYTAWLQGKIAQATQLLSPAVAPQEQGEAVTQ